MLVVVLSLRPMYYLGQVAYYELNIDYIVETYCVNKDKPELQCNGKCHLAKQLQLNDNLNSGEESSNRIAIILECFYPVFNNIQDFSWVTGFKLMPFNNNINYYSNTYAFLRDMSLSKPPNCKV